MIGEVIILDTNVISEITRSSPDSRVLEWLITQPSTSLYTTSVTQAEVLYGIELLAPGRRKDRLSAFAREFFDVEMAGKVLLFDGAAAAFYARIRAAKRSSGHSIPAFDAQIAGIAAAHGASVATRNITDFQNCGVPVINPWEG